ncbi:MAG: aminotransferase class V-fold PLP-dependent enzyme [Phycisphaeraceae bacterium]|nr:aminotransferase class V-fold PLP-dependent enzyme [Phycisphaeraceae bacterium]
MLSNPRQGHALPDPPLPSPHAVHWQHDPSVCFLNHGSFGACPTRVLQAQVRHRNRMEAEPIRFFVEDSWVLLDRARAALAAFVGAHATDLVPIPNATIAVATVLHHLARTGFLGAGDEVLANDHEYPACLNNLRAVCAMVGAAPVIAPIPFPIRSADQAFDAIMSKVTPRTKAALISHVTSSSGLVLPVERLVAALEARGVRTIIDGAHAIGMLPDLNLNTLNASYYTSNCHKWLCTPKGCAFLWIRSDRQHNFRPLVLSNFAEKPKPGRPPSTPSSISSAPTTSRPSSPSPTPSSSSPRSSRAASPPSNPTIAPDAPRTRRDLHPTLHPTPAPDDMIGSICTLLLPQHDPALRNTRGTPERVPRCAPGLAPLALAHPGPHLVRRRRPPHRPHQRAGLQRPRAVRVSRRRP